MLRWGCSAQASPALLFGLPGFPWARGGEHDAAQPSCPVCFTPVLRYNRHVSARAAQGGSASAFPQAFGCSGRGTLRLCTSHGGGVNAAIFFTPLGCLGGVSDLKPLGLAALQQRRGAMDYPVISHRFRLNPVTSAAGHKGHRTRRQKAPGTTLLQVQTRCQSQLSGAWLRSGVMG